MTSKLIALGDTHGHNTWRQVVEKHKDADKIVFIGDYVDSFVITSEDQLSNLLDIIQFKKDNQDRVILIIGNHDHHYWPGVIGQMYSGFQQRMYSSFRKVYTDNKDLFVMAYEDDGTIYSHAGFSKNYIKRIEVIDSKHHDLSAQINLEHQKDPNTFNYYSLDYSGYGNSPDNSNIWIRPQALHDNRIEHIQVVGHTPVKTITLPTYENGVYFIDAMHQGQYLSCTGGVFQIEYIEGFTPSGQ